ncbi:MAG TPA: RagB/SusD family nutrient uptake outer membrane protein [Puia sp.]|nr:RagB/SusD family nutrient uptake outer membrane protein [Puia sp.]
MERVSRERVTFYLLLMTAAAISGCSKSSFLDKKPDTRLVVPASVADFQALLDDQYVMQETPELGELSTDDYYITYSSWQSFKTAKSQNAYTWAKDIYNGQHLIYDWNDPYQQVFYANVVLDGLKRMNLDTVDRLRWNAVCGSAYFIRAYAFYNLSQVFASVYDSSTAVSDMGIPLPLVPDVNAKFTRASVHDTYSQILTDLGEADSLLLSTQVDMNFLNRPSRPAVQALLARIYLSVGAYDQAWINADRCLQLYDSLIMYNSGKDIAIGSNNPIKQTNPETLYQSVLLSSSEILGGGLVKATCIVDSNLYALYRDGDLRKKVFYRVSTSTNVPTLKGSYFGSSFCFSGLAVDEVYLIRAECAARAGNKVAALADLNHLLEHRWDSTFVPVAALTADDARDSILLERRKELAFRGLRWSDLRRLNKKDANITIYHGLNGKVYTLPAKSLNYVLPIPPDVLDFNKGLMSDNPRVDIN